MNRHAVKLKGFARVKLWDQYLKIQRRRTASRRITLGVIFLNSRAGENRELKRILVGKGWVWEPDWE